VPVSVHSVVRRLPNRVYRAACVWLLVCGVAAADPVPAADPAIAVIVAPAHSGASYRRADIANIFRRRLRSADDGQALVPVNLPLDHPLRERFSRAVFDLEPEAMEAYWNERYFHGVSPPHVVGSVEAMLRFVAITPGAIGYVLDCHLDERVSVVLRLPLATGDRQLRHLCPQNPASRQELQTRLAR
tara:strand:- start:116 stop:676 length:561 start_codon:yes stop_codon:yes gene_type:complete